MARKFALISIISLFLTISVLSALYIEKGSADLNEYLQENLQQDALIPVIVVMKEQYDAQLLYDTVKNLSKEERRETTVSTLKQFSEQTQEDIKKELLKREKSKALDSLHFLWIYNSISMQANLEVIEELDKRDDIQTIIYNPKRNMILEDEVFYRNNLVSSIRVDEDISYNIPQIGADKVWEEGYFGQGVVVAVIDSGLNYNHTDIKNNLWISPEYPNYGYSFAYNTNDPIDQDGHGTHCAGTVAGDGTSGIRTGIAPESKIMALQILDDKGRGDDVTLNRALQFAIENGADVLSISLGWYHKFEPNRIMLRNTMMNVLSAGIIASVAAGNAGFLQEYAIPDNVAAPGSCPPPWLNPDQTEKSGLSAVLTVGATEPTDVIADFSSKGPVTWQNVTGFNDYPYKPGIGLIVPDISAPGVDVISLKHDDDTGYKPDSGTSMATPTTAGAIALLISKDPTITPEQIAQIIEESALKKTDKKSNEYGAGRIDIKAACDRIIDTRPPGKPFNINPSDESIDVITYTSLQWKVNLPTTKYILYLGTDNPPTNLINGLELEETMYVPEGLLEPETEYFWRVDSHNQYGSTEGDVWSFKTVLPITIDFENNEFAPYEWDFNVSGHESQQWFISNEVAFDGERSAQSGQINHGSSTRMRLTTRIKEDGIISFYVKTSTEKNGDFLRFYIDNEMIADWSGENDWERVVFPVEAGYRSFSWIYIKDMMVSQGDDTVWIDSVTLPIHYKPSVVYNPQDLNHTFDYDSINLGWGIEINEDANPIEFSLLGYNVYSTEDEGEFTLLNEEPIAENEFVYPYDSLGTYSFYITGVYKIMGRVIESDPSDTYSISIQSTVDTPQFIPEAGEYSEPKTVEIEVMDEECVTFYTIDDTEPTFTSTQYVEPIELTESTTIKAKSYKYGYLSSETVISVYVIETTNVEETIEYPDVFAINLYPNPVRGTVFSRSNPSLSIELLLPSDQNKIDVDIYNIKGQLIKNYSIVSATKGSHNILWDLKNNQNREVINGIYFVKVSADKQQYYSKAIILR
ncbi:MAG: S8 family serine peptidase [Candidatus Cloacimonas sp.]|nr:S8 family serine peptidase [Candidatus Cloacimonadota bacterium]